MIWIALSYFFELLGAFVESVKSFLIDLTYLKLESFI